MRTCRRLPVVSTGKWVRSLAFLVAFVWLAAACAPFAQVADMRAAPTALPTDQTRQLTILYTGYGRGQVDAAHPGPCG